MKLGNQLERLCLLQQRKRETDCGSKPKSLLHEPPKIVHPPRNVGLFQRSKINPRTPARSCSSTAAITSKPEGPSIIIDKYIYIYVSLPIVNSGEHVDLIKERSFRQKMARWKVAPGTLITRKNIVKLPLSSPRSMAPANGLNFATKQMVGSAGLPLPVAFAFQVL